MWKKKLLFVILQISVLLILGQVTETSWYGNNFNGKKTASGEIFDENALTAASPVLPFGTIVLITNITNNKSVKVIINDRGPFAVFKNGKPIYPLKPHPKRKFDLSKKAFSLIANPNVGVIKVKYKILY